MRIDTPNAIIVWSLAALLLASAPLAGVHAAEDGVTKYRIESAVWCEGELRGQPRLTLASGASDSFEISARNTRWRLTVEAQAPGAGEGAEPDSLWLTVGIEQWMDGEWEFLTDTMIGTPLGRPGKITVMGEGETESMPDRAPLYVEMVASRID